MKKQNLLFLHVPKVAGSSMRHHPLIQQSQTIHPLGPEGAWAEIAEKGWANFFKFSFVRNPWDRFVSLYFYFSNMTPDHFAYQYDEPTVKSMKPFKTFDEFCLNFSSLNDGKFHFRPQHLWTHHKNKCFLDFLGKYENLENDLVRLEKRLKFPHCALPHKNKSQHLPYVEYYSPKLIKVVEKIYAEDIELFNYSFNGKN